MTEAGGGFARAVRSVLAVFAGLLRSIIFPHGARGVRLFWQCEETGLAYETEAASIGGALNALMAANSAPEADKRSWSVTMLEARAEKFVGYVENMGERAYLLGNELMLAHI
jgi:hypothetical protein